MEFICDLIGIVWVRNFNCRIKLLGCRNSIPSIALVLICVIRILEARRGIFGVPEGVFTLPGRFGLGREVGRSGPISTMWIVWEVFK